MFILREINICKPPHYEPLHTFAGAKPSIPSSSAFFSYPIGAIPLYVPTSAVNFTVDSSTVRFGNVVVSVAEGAIFWT